MPSQGSPGFEHRIEELLATCLLLIWRLAFAIGGPTPSKGHRVYEVLLKLPQLAHGPQTWTLHSFHLKAMMERINPETALL